LEQVIFKQNGDLDGESNKMLTHISDAFGYWVHGVWPVQRPKVTVGSAYMAHLL
jgi:ribonuclease I